MKAKILIADDSPVCVRSHDPLLETDSMLPEKQKTAKRSWRSMKNKLDVVTLIIMMPEMNGIQIP